MRGRDAKSNLTCPTQVCKATINTLKGVDTLNASWTKCRCTSVVLKGITAIKSSAENKGLIIIFFF